MLQGRPAAAMGRGNQQAIRSGSPQQQYYRPPPPQTQASQQFGMTVQSHDNSTTDIVPGYGRTPGGMVPIQGYGNVPTGRTASPVNAAPATNSSPSPSGANRRAASHQYSSAASVQVGHRVYARSCVDGIRVHSSRRGTTMYHACPHTQHRRRPFRLLQQNAVIMMIYL
jgi:hypothetical protein